MTNAKPYLTLEELFALEDRHRLEDPMSDVNVLLAEVRRHRRALSSGTSWRIETLIKRLQATHANYGNTVVWIRDAVWGAAGLWRQDEQRELTFPMNAHDPHQKAVVAACDPGIRHVVETLMHLGFLTTDSGDGRAKFAAGIADETTLAFPHVHMITKPSRLLEDANRLHAVMLERGILFREPVSIEAIYLPHADAATLSLFGVDDDMLRAGERARAESCVPTA